MTRKEFEQRVKNENLNFSLRKVTRNKSSFPDDDSIYKVMYLAIKNALPTMDNVY